MLPGHIFIFVLSLEQGSWEGAKQTIKSFRIKGTDGSSGEAKQRDRREIRTETEIRAGGETGTKFRSGSEGLELLRQLITGLKPPGASPCSRRGLQSLGRTSPPAFPALPPVCSAFLRPQLRGPSAGSRVLSTGLRGSPVPSTWPG